MKKITLLTLFVYIFIQIFAQSNIEPSSIRIIYATNFNDIIDSILHTIKEISGDFVSIRTVSDRQDANDPKQVTYLDFVNDKETKVALLNGNEQIYTTRSLKINEGLSALNETENIAGYVCKKTETVINSKKLEIWYTDQFGVKGSMQPGVGIPAGVILKIARNGQRAEIAEKIEFLDQHEALQPTLSGKELSGSAYNYRIQQNKVISIKVFDRQSIYFRDIPKQTKLNDTEVMQFANASIVLKKVRLPKNNVGYSIFAEMSQYSEGDASDRTGSVFIIPTDKKQSFLDDLLSDKDQLPKYTDIHGNKYEGMTITADYTPPMELMRFYTSFGVRGYNHIKVAYFNWPDSIIYKQEITDYAKVLKDKVWIGAWIGNYSQNGHNISLDLKYYPKGGKDNDIKDVYPLFTTVNIMEMAGQAYLEAMFRDDSLRVEFNTEVNLQDAYIRYIATGHGGCGCGDEFNPKLNEIFLDDQRLIAYTPWREDCGSYRQFNPASGNFANGLSSSDLSRSGWCPGMVSYPVYINIGDLKACIHQLKVAIPVGDPEGNSHSYWCISGVLVGNQ